LLSFIVFFQGRVLLVKHQKDSKTENIALKILDKQVVVKMKQIDHTLAEKRILQALSCPFIVNLVYTFKDNSYLYLGLEYAPGGDLYTHITDNGKFAETQAKPIFAQIVSAVEHMVKFCRIYSSN